MNQSPLLTVFSRQQRRFLLRFAGSEKQPFSRDNRLLATALQVPGRGFTAGWITWRKQFFVAILQLANWLRLTRVFANPKFLPIQTSE